MNSSIHIVHTFLTHVEHIFRACPNRSFHALTRATCSRTCARHVFKHRDVCPRTSCVSFQWCTFGARPHCQECCPCEFQWCAFGARPHCQERKRPLSEMPSFVIYSPPNNCHSSLVQIYLTWINPRDHEEKQTNKMEMEKQNHAFALQGRTSRTVVQAKGIPLSPATSSPSPACLHRSPAWLSDRTRPATHVRRLGLCVREQRRHALGSASFAARSHLLLI